MKSGNDMTGINEIPDSVLGIDIGSVSLGIVQLDRQGNILKRFCQPHRGKVRDVISRASENFDLDSISAIACTSSSGCLDKNLVKFCNTQVAIITAARHICPDAVSVLHIGAEKFMLIVLDSDGKYRSAKINSSCAAGTGSFLDQQALRLNLSGVDELCERAARNTAEIPVIASRCAVFSKTDIIHAQQRGFSVDSICDSLCKGLAENISNTVFTGEQHASPLIMTGGVSRNSVVRAYLEKQLGTRFLYSSDSYLFGAIGAGLMLIGGKSGLLPARLKSLNDILANAVPDKQFFHKPLALNLSDYPSFSGWESYRLKAVISGHAAEVEADIYSELARGKNYKVFAGIDIGSTSTKAILLDAEKRPVAGFYTYTAGKPLSAVRSILESIEMLAGKKEIGFSIEGAGTTGSGRKFIGQIINADLIIDEITSHARAAYELNPLTDTIIEIGGQDAKFTLMNKGNVTFSQMNSVCAAGTGSFLQEQAEKLGCTVSGYSEIVESVSSPLASDRCAVFMERDIIRLLNNGHSVSEVLATALHSVTENYLQKVANEASIGQHICFQGATARNKALIAAFEQRLNKPIYVSEYCHLTGALGTALMLQEENIGQTRFRGTGIYRQEIPVNTETCTLCTNNCCISIASVSGEKVAYGFMCGRDYGTRRYVSGNKAGFDLLKNRARIFPAGPPPACRHDIIIGLPASLHLFEELPLWQRFFSNLSIRTVTSEGITDPVKTGKCLAGAEFCSPVNSIFGHVVYLSSKADYIFLPVVLQKRGHDEENRGHYCYYTQFSASLVYTLKINDIRNKCLSPLLSFRKGKYHVAQKLFQCLKPQLKNGITFFAVLNAFNEALAYFANGNKLLLAEFRNHFRPEREISVVLLGRPYIVLSKATE